MLRRARAPLQGSPRGNAPRMRMTIDALLLLMTFIWGTNYALVKSAFRELDPQAFNALRLIAASVVMVGTNLIVRRFPSRPADRAPGQIASIFHTPAPVS